MGEEVERLEHHADFAPHLVDALEVAGEFDAVDADHAALMLLEPVDAADQRRLARAGRAADDDALAAADGQIDRAQHMERAVPFVHVDEFDDRIARHRRLSSLAPTPYCRRPSASRRSIAAE